MTKLAALLVLQCTLCVTIRVPVNWNDDSDVNDNDRSDRNQQEDTVKVIPKEYFQYTAAKPQFAVDIATFHDVQSPEEHYSSYPVTPYTGAGKPSLGHHQLLHPEKSSFHPYQRFVNKSSNYAKPVSTFFDVYHPYKSEEPALKEIYKDPVLNKIQNDLRDSKNRLQKYETHAGEPGIEKNEYLERPEQIDHKHTAHENVPAQFEIHRPLRRPAYYKPAPKNYQRDHILNYKVKHPWNQNYVKVTPMHYRPVKSHLQRLRQQHALRYDDEHNEYPQQPPPESLAKKPDGYDIYENGKAKFIELRNNVDESINKAALESKASGNYKLELQDDDKSEVISDDQEDEFVPIKNYAQVRKIETTKHLPRERAFDDAESYEDLINAPRLREAVKSTKAQIVYSEEGYEDSAYDHAGEQKHASDHEGHGGYLKEDEVSRGKYKIPSVSTSHDDESGSEYRDKVLHGKKWKNDEKNVDDERHVEDYSEDEYENTDDADVYADGSNTNKVKTESEKKFDEGSNQSRRKRQEVNENKLLNSTGQHEVNKREVTFEVPEINITSTFLTGKQIDSINKTISKENKTHNDEVLKYPYYFTQDAGINKDSPLRYAENFKLIPKKTQGGTEFYDSRSNIECSEVDDDVDPIPEKLKTGENPENDNDKETEFKKFKNKQRLKGLGNKIDCFKAKYFGVNPLDSPFFTEEIISSPSPVAIPNLGAFGSKYTHKQISEFVQPTNRKKRSTPFVYEPYKIIREGQMPDSRKTTTSSNIGPLIKQLQSSRVIDKTNSKHNTDQVAKRNTNSKVYTDIDKENRQLHSKNENKEISDKSIVSVDHRRGEPRYELPHQNHKAHYTPVENKTALSFEDYKEKMGSRNLKRHQKGDSGNNNVELSKTNHFNFKMYPEYNLKSPHLQDIAASNAISRIIETTTPKINTQINHALTDNHAVKDDDEFEDDEEDDEEDDDEDEDEDYEERDEDEEKEKYKSTTTTTTTTTTRRPLSRKSTTTQKPIQITQRSINTADDDYNDNKPKLQLVTRFRNQPAPKSEEKSSDTSRNKYPQHVSNTDETDTPKYREKKKKVSQSTLVTDTKMYTEGNDDMRQEDIDAMIGVKQAINDYMPSYEKETKVNNVMKSDIDEELDSDEYYKINNNSEDDDDDENEDDEDSEEEDEDDDEDNNHEDDNDESYETDVTTQEPTKRTLPSTTEKIVPTTEILKANIDAAPKISRKRIEIHKELPINKSSPNISQYRQDIKEVEIIKEIPSRSRNKNKKNGEVLDLYKDINLAKDINKLGGVEIFKENLDLTSGPRHGGNYRQIEPENLKYESTSASNKQDLNKDDVETSQSEPNKYLEVDIIPSSRTRKINRSRSHVKQPTGDKVKNSKLIELSEVPNKSMHGGNFKLPQSRGRVRNKNAKFIELNDDDKEETNSRNGGNFKNYGTRRNDMHGGNYRSERLRQSEDNQDLSKDLNIKNTPTKSTSKVDKNNAALLLNGYVRAMPILTTTPIYILDPSKRKYYYVDA